MDNKKIYCSLDIETSGFDPLKNEIIEIGLVFFDISDKGLKITGEYTKVFKPKGEVPPNILGLTGISQKELDGAEAFESYKSEIQDKVGGAVIVGHNVIFDTRFLQSLGVEFSGRVVDTLDLAQFILPTHHSYNLENLMHTFGLDHKDAHRALSDSRATALLLERMLEIYSGFPKELKAQIEQTIKPYDLEFKQLLGIKLKSGTVKKKILTPGKQSKPKNVKLKAGSIYNFAIGTDYITQLALMLTLQKSEPILVLPKRQQVMQLWKQKSASPLFMPEDRFDEKKFQAFLKKENLSADEIKFLLKILVWKYTNWQTEYILDLNLSFFGGQFRGLVSGGAWPDLLLAKTGNSKPAPDKIICCDQETFLAAAKHGMYAEHFIIIAGLADFEVAVSNTMGTKVSWGHILYLLRSIYNPEFGLGNEQQKQVVEELLSASDLFFGLVHALLHTATTNFQYVKIGSELLQSDNFNKIKSAAENYKLKLIIAQQQLRLDGLQTFIEKLSAFFEEDKNAIKWIELADKRCVLFSSPLDIAPLVQKTLTPYQNTSFADSLGVPMLSNYFLKRLGLSSWPIEQLKQSTRKSETQPDLFSTAKSSIACHLEAKNFSSGELADLISSQSLPAALLFSTGAQVRQFHEDQYQELQQRAFVLVQGNSGGNRLFRNFYIHPNSLLIATDKFILKYLQGEGTPVESLGVKTLIICHLPFEQFNHPYQETLAERFSNPFEEFSLPKALYNFHCLLVFFNTPTLESIYICDAKLTKDYSNVFKDYVQLLPGVKLIG